MIKTKIELIKKIDKLGDQTIEKGLQFKNLSKSIKQRKEEKTLKEWLEFIKPYLNKLEEETEK